MQYYINNYLKEIKEKIPKKLNISNKFIDLDSVIANLYNDVQWEDNKEKLVEKLATRVEITKKFDDKYTLEWTKYKDAKSASSFQSSLATLALYASFKKLQEINATKEKLFKRMNSILKALDISKEQWISEGSSLYKEIFKDYQLLIKNSVPKNLDFTNILSLDKKTITTKTVPITILYSDGPIARAYLEIFKSLGIKPRKIIEMVSSLDISTKKQIGTLLPNKLRVKYARYSQETKINYWPRDIEKRYPELQNVIFKEVSHNYNISNDMLKSTTKKLDISNYCDNIETILVTGLRDKKLEEKLKDTIEDNILYTGGGIVPSTLLNIKNTKFIHIHPGYLPDVRGADCALWSSMIFGRASASCFYMSPGIDTGDIIMPKWMPELSFNIEKKYDYKTLYRATYSFIDPWIRATVLREFLTTYNKLDNIKTVEQNEKDGYTYYFMHERMKKLALDKLFSLKVC